MGADHGGAAPPSTVRRESEAGCMAAVGPEDVRESAELRAGPGAARPDARHLGLWKDRAPRCRLRQGVRHERADLGPRAYARGGQSRWLRRRGESRSILRAKRRAVVASASA